jgi:H2-forming N5,N10-methylenetetrahydromethanopterin dehydrogenase-like enzyme
MLVERETPSARTCLCHGSLPCDRAHPNTTFEVMHGDDPTGIYVLATVDVEDTEAVMDVYIDRLLELQIDAGLAVYVVPVRPLARVLASAGSNF